MTAAWWLAIAGLPVFQQPLPETPGEPAALAVMDGRASLRLPCYQLVCADAEWMAPTPFTTLWTPKAPGTRPQLRATRVSSLATRRYASLRAPVAPRDWFDTEASRARVATSFGVEALRRPGTDLKLELGTGYRLQPYAGYGTATAGPIARGGLWLTQDFGERTRLKQHVMVETGRENTVVRQVIGLDFRLQPDWTLQSRLEMKHDTGAFGRPERTDTRGSLDLRYSF